MGGEPPIVPPRPRGSRIEAFDDGEHLVIRVPPRIGCSIVFGMFWAAWVWLVAASALYGPLSRAIRGAGGAPSALEVLASAAPPLALALAVLLYMAEGFFRHYELAVHGDALTVLDGGLFRESRRQWPRDDIDRIFVRSALFTRGMLCIQPWRGIGRRLPGRAGLFGEIRLATHEEWEWVAALLRRALERTAGPSAPAEGRSGASPQVRRS